METDYILDTVGRFCPVPIIETANKIKEMKAGETLTIISDDPGIKNDMPNWCSLTGNEYLGMSEENGEIRVYVRKTVPK
jgi:tRNA 2-thiouridine synthesizing protein A